MSNGFDDYVAAFKRLQSENQMLREILAELASALQEIAEKIPPDDSTMERVRLVTLRILRQLDRITDDQAHSAAD
jgi:hypothetical protein